MTRLAPQNAERTHLELKSLAKASGAYVRKTLLTGADTETKNAEMAYAISRAIAAKATELEKIVRQLSEISYPGDNVIDGFLVGGDQVALGKLVETCQEVGIA